MLKKDVEKKRAVILRKQGKTYNEILNEINVSKSTLSLWLRDVGLASAQKQQLSIKKKTAQQRGAARMREIRVEQTALIHQMSAQEISKLSKRDLFMLGVALYWAEGTKEKVHRHSVPVEFANSDSNLVRLFVKWLLLFGGVNKDDIVLRLHIHETSEERVSSVKKYWCKNIGLKESSFTSVLYKKHNPKTVRKNSKNDYNGLVSVRVKRSTQLNRRIQGHINAIVSFVQQ